MQNGSLALQRYLAQFRWLREYFVMHHLQVTLEGIPLRDPAGALLGYLEEIRLHQGRVHLRGWARVQGLSLRLGAAVRRQRPHEEREDVALALGGDPQVGFRCSLPFADAPLEIEMHRDGLPDLRQTLPLPSRRRRAWAEHRLRLRFWRAFLPLVPMIALGLHRRDLDLPRRVKTALGLGQLAVDAALDPRFLADATPDLGVAPPEPITIVLPVYDAFDLLPEVLERVATHTDLPWHLVAIEDASPDPRVRPWLRAWVQARPAGQITLLENETNLGFIGSVNRGYEAVRAAGRAGPVVLLNSDALVPPGWARRLTAPLQDPTVATVTPMSNDAEIFSAPVVCTRTELNAGQGDRIDAALRTRVKGTDAPPVAAPTGVGFCMAIGPDWFARIGSFDTDFGRGYGEEVDWCRRVAALGGRHVAAANLFVEHRGGASFGTEKQALVQRNNSLISARYPGYDRLVQEFVQTDPLVTPRLVAALAWAESLPDNADLPVYIAHSMGGGAESYLQARLKRHTVALSLRLGDKWRCRLELDTPSGRLVANADNLGLVCRLLRAVPRRRVVYSCAVGDPDLSALPAFLLAAAEGAALEMLFHDYLPLSPSYTLLDHDGVYRGVPPADTLDPAHRYRRPDGTVMTLADWRTAWGAALARADRLVVFSTASTRIVEAAYPGSAARTTLRPHRLLQSVPRLEPPAQPRKVIGVLGAIGPQKGAAVLAALSARLAHLPDAGLALIGYIAPGFPLHPSTAVHGHYAPEDIPELAARYGVTHWLIPSVWPETFSYTVHECLATGLPTMAFDLGAQGEAVRAAPNGLPLPWTQGERDPDALARAVLQAIAHAPSHGLLEPVAET